MQDPVVLATGGTGGHIFPALAVAEALSGLEGAPPVVFIGGTYGAESRLIAEAGYPFYGLPVRGVIGRGRKAIGAAAAMLKAIWQARNILGTIQPCCVLGFGGYAAFAGVAGARLRGIPTAIHEQNALPGTSNALLGRLVRRVYLSFPDTVGFAPDKTVWVGNPVRGNIRPSKRYDPDFFTSGVQAKHLLVMGGSQGAKAINDAVLAILPQLNAAGLHIWHQTGTADHERVVAAYAAQGFEHARIEPFIVAMDEAYTWADLALCRAGGSSLAELLLAGIPSIYIPFPHAAHNHQWYNASFVSQRGGAILMSQSDITHADGHNHLARAIIQLMQDSKQRMQMATVCKELARPQAAHELAVAITRCFL